MNITLLMIFGIVLLLYIMQGLGAYLQIKNYKKSVLRLHRQGNVGIGQKKGGFSFGYLVLVVCDNKGIVRTAEHMKGMTIFAKFRPFNQVAGMNFPGAKISDLLDRFKQMDDRKQKHYKGYIQALEALCEKVK